MAFEYNLPDSQIAQRPVEGERTNARLLVVDNDSLLDRHVYELPELLSDNALLVMNDTKVVASRFFPEEGLDEVFLLRRIDDHGRYHAIGRPFRKVREGSEVRLSPHLQGTIQEKRDGEFIIELRVVNSNESLDELLSREALVPIPPYIRGGHSDDRDRETYQTVFASHPGSIAAPTAALHFTESLFQQLEARGVELLFLTLHVGAASILPVERQLQQGGVAEEEFVIPERTFAAIRQARETGREIVAVGTTVTRALESLSPEEWAGGYDFQPRFSDLFIQPGFRFQIVDRLMTNFHQSGSTHLSLVSAFAGLETMRTAYAHAVKTGYRFLSYGDSSLLSRAGR